jgi:hypothetical protein
MEGHWQGSLGHSRGSGGGRKKPSTLELCFPEWNEPVLETRARKSRAVDNACVVFYAGTRPKRMIPDHALDKHTKRGRSMGRGSKHFFEEAAVSTLVKNTKAEQGTLI